MRFVAAVLAMTHAAAGWAAQFSDGLGSAWEFADRDGFCVLQQPVADYGVARFTGVPRGALHFEVLGHRELFAQGAVELTTVAPPWHASFPAERRLGQLDHGKGAGIRVSDPIATRVLMALRDGLDMRLQQQPWYDGDRVQGEPVVIAVSAVGIRALYAEFVRCAQGSPIPGWAEIQRTRVGFPTSGAALTSTAVAQLHAVADYVRHDPWLTGVFVDGHTDALGTQRANYELSQQRAQAVRACLVDAGVDPTLITVRYHGASYPVGDNETAEGRRSNRRATVRLERRWPDLAQSQPSTP